MSDVINKNLKDAAEKYKTERDRLCLEHSQKMRKIEETLKEDVNEAIKEVWVICADYGYYSLCGGHSRECRYFMYSSEEAARKQHKAIIDKLVATKEEDKSYKKDPKRILENMKKLFTIRKMENSEFDISDFSFTGKGRIDDIDITPLFTYAGMRRHTMQREESNKNIK